MHKKLRHANSTREKNKKFYYRKKRYDLAIIGKAKTFNLIKDEHPHFVKYMLDDLLHIEGYTDTEVAFGLKVPIHFIRKIIAGDCNQVSRDVFLSILSLYARVFCGWCDYQNELGDSE